MMNKTVVDKTTPFALVPLFLGFLCLLATAASVIFLSIREQEATSSVRMTLQVENKLSQIQTLAANAESGQRGYLLTGRLGYLEPYDLARRELPQQLDQLESELLDPDQKTSFMRLRKEIGDKLAELQSTVDLRAENRLESALIVVNNDNGTRIRGVIGEMREREQNLLEFRTAHANQLSLISRTTLIASVLLVVLLAIVALLDGRRRILALQKANKNLETQMAERLIPEGQVRELQKREVIGQLTGGIAHDFNNMLAIIIGSLEMAIRRLSGNEHPTVQKSLGHAREGAERAAILTSRLLAFSRQQPLEPRVLDPNKLVAGMSELLRSTIEEKIVIETVLAGGIWRVFTDAAQIESAIINLAVNARDAMSNGGKLTIETSNTDLDERYASAHDEVTAGQYVMLSVTDTGHGMPPEIIERAFDPFYSTKGVGKGTGLGLSQVFGFIKQSKGHVKIYSEVGQGTTVKIYLPRYSGALPISANETTSGLMPNGKSDEIILVVEDDARVGLMSVDALRELGYTVIHAQTPNEALKLAEAHPNITLLFTDIVMPKMNGRELADRVAKLRPGIVVLYTTGYTPNAIVHNGIVDPGMSFLPKPFTLDQLARKIRLSIDGKI